MSEATIEQPADFEQASDDVLPHGRSCPHCGAPFESHDSFCTGCGGPVEGEPAEAEVVEAEVVEQKHFRCQNCGSEVAADLTTRSYTCPFCDSTYVTEYSPEETGRQRPEFVIGFAVTLEQAQQKFQQWLRSNRWFRPGDLTSAQIEEKLRGIYMPFWSFSMLAQSKWSATIGEYWYRTETYTTMQNGKMVTKTRRVRETEWWNLDGRHHEYYNGYLLSGSRGLSQADADRIKPFHLPALKRYKPFFLAGWLSEEYSIDRDMALERCKQYFYQREKENVAAFLPGDTHRGLNVQVWFSQANSDLILLPLYLLSYRYRDKLYRFMINGQTGQIAGDKPISKKRIAVAVVAGLALVAILVLLALLLRGA
jgi:hypothetical protein